MKTLVKSFLLIIIFSLSAGTVIAQNTVDLIVSPPNQEINLNPGEEKRIQIKFYNRSEENISGQIKKADFLVLDKDGSPTLIDNSATNNRFAASTWINLSEEKVALTAKNQVIITAYIKVPLNAYPCGHYTSIYFEPTPVTLGGQQLKQESAAAIAFKLASLIYINVAGECKEKALISKMDAPLFQEYGPIIVDMDILNRSDYHIVPKTVLQTKNFLKKTVDIKPIPENNIFPDAIRNYRIETGQKWMFGPYTIILQGGYGKTGQTLYRSLQVWVVPWRIMIVILLFLIIVYLTVKSLFGSLSQKETLLEKQLKQEIEEVKKLKEQLKKRD
jgi:hypothetical protein